jgi:hypothetical protein
LSYIVRPCLENKQTNTKPSRLIVTFTGKRKCRTRLEEEKAGGET